MEEEKINCQNCEKPYTDGFDFCPHCGQKTNEDLTIGVLFYNTIANYFSFDARFLKSFIPLMFKPGYLAKRFLEGKRLLYLHPAQMYLFVSVIFFFLSSSTVARWEKEANSINEKIVKAPLVSDSLNIKKPKLDSVTKQKILKDLKDNQTALGIKDEDLKLADSVMQSDIEDMDVTWDFDKQKIDSLIATGATDQELYKAMGMPDDAGYFKRGMYKGALSLAKGSGAGSILRRAFDAVPISMFILLPLFAFILKLFYFRRGRYAHHLVFSFYFFSFLFTLFAMLIAVNRFLFPIPEWITWLIVLSTFFYFYIALLKFYQRHWFTTFIKSGIITFIFMSFVIPITGVLLIMFGMFEGN